MADAPQQEGRTSAGPLVRSLLNDGSMSPDWAEAFEAVPRAAFLPDGIWAHDMTTGGSTYVHRLTDPGTWEQYAESVRVPIITQWDDGEHAGPDPGRIPTSSSSEPRLVAAYLRDADVRPPMRVLLIGTGTGWDTGLLSYRLGGGSVFSVEVDPAVAEAARSRLLSRGLYPVVITGDGSLGFASGSPYDRVIITAGVRAIAPALLEQTREGGLILCPWGTHYDNVDALLRLTVSADGSASGPFLRMVEFMKLRNQRLDWGRFDAQIGGEYPGSADESTTTLTPADLGGRWTTARFVMGLALRDCTHAVNNVGGVTRAWFLSLSDESWASIEFRQDETPATVYQSGPRRLVGEVETALHWWERQGRPPLDRFGLTVTPDGTQRPWLGDLSNPLPALN